MAFRYFCCGLDASVFKASGYGSSSSKFSAVSHLPTLPNTAGPSVVCQSEMAVRTSTMTDSDSLFRSSGPDPEDIGLPAVSDARLVEDARRGSTESFGQLVLRYERRVIRVIRRFMPDDQIAQDLTQEAFLRAFERLEQFDPSRRFGPWLFRIAVNLTYVESSVAENGRYSVKPVRNECRIRPQQIRGLIWTCRRRYRWFWRMSRKPIEPY